MPAHHIEMQHIAMSFLPAETRYASAPTLWTSMCIHLQTQLQVQRRGSVKEAGGIIGKVLQERHYGQGHSTACRAPDETSEHHSSLLEWSSAPAPAGPAGPTDKVQWHSCTLRFLCYSNEISALEQVLFVALTPCCILRTPAAEGSLRKIVQQDGVRGLYKGLAPSLMALLPK